MRKADNSAVEEMQTPAAAEATLSGARTVHVQERVRVLPS